MVREFETSEMYTMRETDLTKGETDPLRMTVKF